MSHECVCNRFLRQNGHCPPTTGLAGQQTDYQSPTRSTAARRSGAATESAASARHSADVQFDASIGRQRRSGKSTADHRAAGRRDRTPQRPGHAELQDRRLPTANGRMDQGWRQNTRIKKSHDTALRQSVLLSGRSGVYSSLILFRNSLSWLSIDRVVQFRVVQLEALKVSVTVLEEPPKHLQKFL